MVMWKRFGMSLYQPNIKDIQYSNLCPAYYGNSRNSVKKTLTSLSSEGAFEEQVLKRFNIASPHLFVLVSSTRPLKEKLIISMFLEIIR